MWKPLPPPTQLLPSLYHLSDGGAAGAGGAIQEQLESMAGEVARVVEEQLQVRRSESRWVLGRSAEAGPVCRPRWR